MSADFLRQLAANLPDDAHARADIYRAARELMFRAEPPRETCMRMYYGNTAAAAAVTATDLGLFRTLADEPHRTWSPDDLATETGASADLLLRILRTLAAFGAVGQPAAHAFQATNNTAALASPFAESSAQAQTQFHGPTLLALPEYLRDTGYADPTGAPRTAFHRAYGTDMAIMPWISAHPEWSGKLMAYMAVQRAGQTPWMASAPTLLSGFDIALSDADAAAGRAAFVDVGGSVAHQCVAFREHFPQLRGAVVCQDLPFAVALAREDARLAQLGITLQAHDFTTPQTAEARGAKVFYMRNVLHDWADDKDAGILGHLRDAMADDSLLVIDECVVPDVGAAPGVAALDIDMMAFPGARERSRGMWAALVERRAGLRIRAVRTYDEESCDSLILVTKG